MKAIISSGYGSPDTLQIKDIDIPIPQKGEVLVKIMATTINDWDWSLVTGKPVLYRLMFGLMKPKHPVPGIELAGIVEHVGEGVTRFRKGDEVYGDLSSHGWGSWCEYASVKEDSISLKPETMSFEEAVCLPHAALLAYQGLKLGKISHGMDILLNGAGGGMGTLAFHIAKTYGASITGVDSSEKLDTMKEMGFDEVIDYKKVDFTRNEHQYDLILDAKTTRSPGTYTGSLKPEGKYVTVGGHLDKLVRLFLGKKGFYRKEYRNLEILPLKPNEGLDEISDLFLQGKLKPVIDGPYPLEKIPELLQYFGDGLHKGKIVIKVA